MIMNCSPWRFLRRRVEHSGPLPMAAPHPSRRAAARISRPVARFNELRPPVEAPKRMRINLRFATGNFDLIQGKS